ncbi:hypothetical protein ACFLTI_06900 [Bacteroidota bacterium]
MIGITVLSPVYHEVIDVFNYIRFNKPKAPICLGVAYVTTIMEEIFEETPVRVELITTEIAHLMKKSGCYNVGMRILYGDMHNLYLITSL